MRRPAPTASTPCARLAAYGLLAGVGALQWVRYVEGAPAGRALAWVAAGVATGIAVLAAGRLPRRWSLAAAAAAAAAGGLLAILASGLELRLLLPRNWEALGDGLGRGVQTLNTVRLPYIGRDPWVMAAVEVSGALLCWAAAVAAAWPRGARGRPVALVLLLALVAAPVVSLGAARPVWLGLALAALTAAFLFGERLRTRPGLGLAALAGGALAVAVPLGTAVDREQPWFDYKAFSENFSPGAPISFDWAHGYGPIDWPREGAEILRVASAEPMYWKADQLVDFDGARWVTGARRDLGGDRATDDLPLEWRDRTTWQEEVTVALRRLRTPTVVGPGTVLSVSDASRAAVQDVVPGRWIAGGGRAFGRGDSYTVRAYVPQPTRQQLARATVGDDPRAAAYLSMEVEYRPDAYDRAPRFPSYQPDAARPLTHAEIAFPAFEAQLPPVATFRVSGEARSGSEALDASHYDRTWRLAQRLRARATSAYDYVLRVNAHLRGPAFRYTESPPPPGDEAPLEAFLFDSRRGYCQHYAGAMALLLRMGGVPARVATGFSPGGFRETTGEWIVRDTDAHSWVEAWFDGIGWVPFDATPSQTPARSLVAAIDPTPDEAPGGGSAPRTTGAEPDARRPEALTREAPVGVASPGGGTPAAMWPAGAVALLVLAGGLLTLRARRRLPGGHDADLRELERALRRSGRDAPAGTTLAQLERRLGSSAEGAAYLRSLRAARFGPVTAGPTNADRAAFRRELAAGLGLPGRVRALWALPPRVYPFRGRPR